MKDLFTFEKRRRDTCDNVDRINISNARNLILELKIKSTTVNGGIDSIGRDLLAQAWYNSKSAGFDSIDELGRASLARQQ